MSGNNKKKPFHEVILVKIGEQIEHLPSPQAEADLRKYGTILRESILPKDKVEDIQMSLLVMLNDVKRCHDTKADKYIKKLLNEIGQ